MTQYTEWEQRICEAWDDPARLQEPVYKQAVEATIEQLDQGWVRVAEYVPEVDRWVTHEWVKKAVLLYFKICVNTEISAGPLNFRDKIPVKSNLEAAGVRVVPPEWPATVHTWLPEWCSCPVT